MKQNPRQQTKTDNYCIRECPTGLRLKELGNQLKCRERKQVAWDEEEQEQEELAANDPA
ncbi:hypothetical protein BN871_EA_00160 [Paenibacillus sp. P22]|nr:hypothetical protein BN871_EA_00160 [Paenibacillus sp. P22]